MTRSQYFITIFFLISSCTKERSDSDCWKVSLKFRSNVAGYHLRVQKDYTGDIEFVQQLVKVDSATLWHWQIRQPFCNGYNKNPNLSGNWIIDRKSYYFSDPQVYYINIRRGPPGVMATITARVIVPFEQWQQLKEGNNFIL